MTRLRIPSALRPRLLAASALFMPRIWPLMEPQVKAAFDSRARSWDTTVGSLHTAALRAALSSELVQKCGESGGVLLDVGCGTGLGTELLREAFPTRPVLGMDISLEMLRVAASKEWSRRSHVYWVVGDASRPPMRRGCAALVVSMNAPPFVGSLARLLGPGGVLLFVWSEGPRTPIWIDPRLVKLVCRRNGLHRFEEGRGGGGVWLAAARG